MLKTNVSDINQLEISLVRKLKYMENNEDEQWKINIANELINCRHGDVMIAGFTSKEIDDIKEYVCTI